MKPRNRSNEFVLVATFHERAEAEKLRALLVAGGMPAQLQAENTLQKYGFLGTMQPGIRVEVPGRFLEGTRKILARRQAAECLKKAMHHCPACDSTRVQYPAVMRKNMVSALVTRLLVLLHLAQHKYYCEDCHFTWAEKTESASGPAGPQTAGVK